MLSNSHSRVHGVKLPSQMLLLTDRFHFLNGDPPKVAINCTLVMFSGFGKTSDRPLVSQFSL